MEYRVLQLPLAHRCAGGDAETEIVVAPCPVAVTLTFVAHLSQRRPRTAQLEEWLAEQTVETEHVELGKRLSYLVKGEHRLLGLFEGEEREETGDGEHLLHALVDIADDDLAVGSQRSLAERQQQTQT